MREWASVYLKGFFMGAADSVPGVSGGTIALITGIYERIIAAITAAEPSDLRHLLRVHTADGRAEVAGLFRRVDLPFMLVLGTGIATAVVVLSRVMHAAIQDHPGPTFGFFFGLIAASAVVLFNEVDVGTPRRAAVAVAGVVFAVAVSAFSTGGVSHSVPVIFVAGAVAICAMVLPGVSGAFLLVLLGQYEYLTGRLSAFVDAIIGLLDGGTMAAVVDPGTVVLVFGCGAVIGLLSMAHAINWALASYRSATLTLLVSLMVGGLYVPGAEIAAAASTGTEWALAAAAAVVGGVAVLGLDRYTDDLDY